jgi:hypothetical protein
LYNTNTTNSNKDELPHGEAERIGKALGLSPKQVDNAYKSGMYKLKESYKAGLIDLDVEDLLIASLSDNKEQELVNTLNT